MTVRFSPRRFGFDEFKIPLEIPDKSRFKAPDLIHSRRKKMKVLPRNLMIAIVLLAWAATPMRSQTNVLTWHNDNWRDGLNSSETVLTQSNVNATQFGKICSVAFDGQVFGQPLVVSNAGTNTVYMATMNDSVYAVNGANCSVINSVSLLQANEEAVQCVDV